MTELTLNEKEQKKQKFKSKLEKIVEDFKNYLLEQRKKDIENAIDYEIEMFEWENRRKATKEDKKEILKKVFKQFGIEEKEYAKFI